MGDLFGGPFFHAPCLACLQGHYGGRVMTAFDSGGSPFGGWRCHLFPQFGGAAKGKRL